MKVNSMQPTSTELAGQQPAQPSELPSYEQLLIDQYGADTVNRTRAVVQATPGLGDPSKTVGVGMVAPDFALTDSAGTLVELADLRARGPVVVIFYRGGWCPFCNMYLRAFQLARSRIRALGAHVVLISPQRPAVAQALSESHSLLFPLLSDVDNQVARRYGLVFQMPRELREEYLADGVDLAQINGEQSWAIPMPATFVVDQDRTIRYGFVSADYTQRADPNEILAVLQRLKHGR